MPHVSDVPNDKSKNEIQGAVAAPLCFLAELQRRPVHPTPERAGIATDWSPRLADPYPQVAVGGLAVLEVLRTAVAGVSHGCGLRSVVQWDARHGSGTRTRWCDWLWFVQWWSLVAQRALRRRRLIGVVVGRVIRVVGCLQRGRGARGRD